MLFQLLPETWIVLTDRIDDVLHVIP